MQRTLTILLLVPLLLSSAIASADQPPPGPLQTTVTPKPKPQPIDPALRKQLETQYQAEIARRHFRNALKVLNRLYRLAPEARYLLELAGCYQRLKKPFNALILYAEYLRRQRDSAKRAVVAREVKRLEAPITRIAEKFKARGKLKQALKHYLVLFRATSDAQYLLEVGTLYEQLQRPFLAMRVYQDLQAHHRTPLITKQIPHRIAALRTQLYRTHGELRVTTSPAGASIIIAGKTYPETTPTTVWLTHGRHELVLKKGAREVRRSVDVSGKLISLNATLGDVGYLTLVCDRSGARVRIDGQLVGQTPLAKPIALDAGRHHVHVQATTGEQFARNFELAANQALTLTVDWSRQDQTPPQPDRPTQPYRPDYQRYPDLNRPRPNNSNLYLQQLKYQQTTRAIDTAMWVTLTTGILSTSIGGGLMYYHFKKSSSSESSTGTGTTTTTSKKSKTLLYAGIGTLVAGGALLTTSLVLYFVKQKRRSYRRRPYWGIGPSIQGNAFGISGTLIY